MRVSTRKKTPAGIDLSPMLDVIFQLILFFLVSTTFANLPGISVNLPQSSTAQGTDVSGITITVEESGMMYFNQELVTLKTLEKKLNAFDVGSHKKETYPVTLSCDEKVTNGTIVGIFDVLRKCGFSAVSLRTTAKK